ncbi:MFS transporter [Lichenicoccus sp.]|uniref:MFS transporter n=1 Tax=Lichenicoccus sp. TaxID=2781899 RepID=UPI003D12DF79
MPAQRWTMIILCALATTINYVDRATLSVAAPAMQRALHLGPATMGLLLGAFFWTYALMQIPGGWVVDRIGARAAYAGAVAWWSTCTAATALVRGAGTTFGLRLLLGVGEAGSYPSNTKVAALCRDWSRSRPPGWGAGRRTRCIGAASA